MREHSRAHRDLDLRAALAGDAALVCVGLGIVALIVGLGALGIVLLLLGAGALVDLVVTRRRRRTGRGVSRWE
ncbi:MAG: hypothetical protein ACTHK1_04315 [Actinomycetales bacterium]